MSCSQLKLLLRTNLLLLLCHAFFFATIGSAMAGYCVSSNEAIRQMSRQAHASSSLYPRAILSDWEFGDVSVNKYKLDEFGWFEEYRVPLVLTPRYGKKEALVAQCSVTYALRLGFVCQMTRLHCLTSKEIRRR